MGARLKFSFYFRAFTSLCAPTLGILRRGVLAALEDPTVEDYFNLGVGREAFRQLCMEIPTVASHDKKSALHFAPQSGCREPPYSPVMPPRRLKACHNANSTRYA